MSEPGVATAGEGDGFARMRTIADTVLYEGYLLYPYRASAEKNQLRWQFGVLAPRVWGEATGREAWWTQTECLIVAEADVRVAGRARFLQPEARRLEARRDDGSWEAVPRLEADGRIFAAWDEAQLREVDFAIDVPTAEAPFVDEIAIETDRETRIELLRDASGAEIGRYVRESTPLRGRIRVSCERVEEPRPHLRLRLRAENETPAIDPSASRDDAMRSSFAGFHLLLVAEDGAFISSQDPAAWAREAVSTCQNVGAWPVLAGEEGDETMLFSAPIILSDHPQVAPESLGDHFDATEIDEILSLRTMTLTEAEKREARATDPRAAAIIDRCDGLAPEWLERLHGAVRSWRPVAEAPVSGPIAPIPAPQLYSEGLSSDDAAWEGWTDPTIPGEGSVEIDGCVIERGSRVRLRPNRRSDAQDFMLHGREARVEGVYEDLEGRTYLGVTLADAPDADLVQGHGRHLYFFPDEVVPLRGGG